MTHWYDQDKLPQFAQPPVSEVALGFEHAAIPTADILFLADLQDIWKSDFAELEVLPASPPSFVPDGVYPGIQVSQGAPPQKIWASNKAAGLLLQTQADRLVLNWRRDFEAGPYPGFSTLREEYSRRWDEYRDYVATHASERPIPILAEYTYVNTIELEPGQTIDSVISTISDSDHSIPGSSIMSRFQFARQVNKNESNPFDSQITTTGEPIAVGTSSGLLLTVSVRCLVVEGGAPPEAALDAAHALASHTFAATVTENMSATWGRVR